MRRRKEITCEAGPYDLRDRHSLKPVSVRGPSQVMCLCCVFFSVDESRGEDFEIGCQGEMKGREVGEVPDLQTWGSESARWFTLSTLKDLEPPKRRGSIGRL